MGGLKKRSEMNALNYKWHLYISKIKVIFKKNWYNSLTLHSHLTLLRDELFLCIFVLCTRLRFL